jgi:hypothetical protein
MEMQYIGHILYLSSYPNCLIVLPTMKIKQQYTHDISFQIMEGRTFRSQYNYRLQPF